MAQTLAGSCDTVIGTHDIESQLTKDTPFLFLSLPRELRDMVYAFALQAPGSILIWGNTWDISDMASNRKKITGVAIIRTCKQIYDEAGPLLYKCNTFTINLEFVSPDDDLPPLHVSVMRNVIEPYLGNAFQPELAKQVTTLSVQIPMEKIRKLEILLTAAELKEAERYPRFKMVWLTQGLKLALHLALWLDRCVNQCTELDVFRVISLNWDGHPQDELLEWVAKHAFNLVNCKGRIEWVEEGAHSNGEDKMWISEEGRAAVEKCSKGNVMFKVVLPSKTQSA